MKYVIELKKDGVLRGEMLRATEAEAAEIVREWVGRGCGNTADWHREEKLWIAVYCAGDLDVVVDDDRFSEMEESGTFNGDLWDWALVRDGKFYETLSEAMYASMDRYGI